MATLEKYTIDPPIASSPATDTTPTTINPTSSKATSSPHTNTFPPKQTAHTQTPKQSLNIQASKQTTNIQAFEQSTNTQKPKDITNTQTSEQSPTSTTPSNEASTSYQSKDEALQKGDEIAINNSVPNGSDVKEKDSNTQKKNTKHRRFFKKKSRNNQTDKENTDKEITVEVLIQKLKKLVLENEFIPSSEIKALLDSFNPDKKTSSKTKPKEKPKEAASARPDPQPPVEVTNGPMNSKTKHKYKRFNWGHQSQNSNNQHNGSNSFYKKTWNSDHVTNGNVPHRPNRYFRKRNRNNNSTTPYDIPSQMSSPTSTDEAADMRSKLREVNDLDTLSILIGECQDKRLNHEYSMAINKFIKLKKATSNKEQDA